MDETTRMDIADIKRAVLNGDDTLAIVILLQRRVRMLEGRVKILEEKLGVGQ